MTNNRIVINEMYAWRKHLKGLGIECKISKTWLQKGWHCQAQAWDIKAKVYRYLLIKKA